MNPLSRVPAPLLLGAGIVSVQVGAGFAARLFGTVSAAGLTGLRLWAASVVLVAIGGAPAGRAVREVVAKRSWHDAAVVGAFGVTLAVMNFSIYQSFARIPLGIAVTIEFLGPLCVAVASSRKLIDLLWVALAAGGVVLLGTAGVSAASFGAAAAAYSPGSRSATVAIGLVYAFIAGASWACYILLSRATGKRFSGSSGLVISMAIAAVVIIPAAVGAGSSLFHPSILAAGLAIGLLSSVIPYGFELETLRRVSARAFGIWMSLEPAVAALVGVAMLGQSLRVTQWLAVGCVIIASAGAAAKGDGVPQALPPDHTMVACQPIQHLRQP